MQNRASWIVCLVVFFGVWPLEGGWADHVPHDPIALVGNVSADRVDSADSVGPEDLSRLFQNYKTDTLALVDVFATMMTAGGTPPLWAQAHEIVVRLEKQSSWLLTLGRKNRNPTWEHYASNLYHHCLELQETTQRGDARESLLLAAILISHIGQVQSANPRWLVWHVSEQLRILQTGIQSRDKDTVRDAAEIIHESANRILLSASVVPEVYRHQNWRRNIHQINGLGDTILGDVNQGEWEKVLENAILIEHIFLRWAESFKEPAR